MPATTPPQQLVRTTLKLQPFSQIPCMHGGPGLAAVHVRHCRTMLAWTAARRWRPDHSDCHGNTGGEAVPRRPSHRLPGLGRARCVIIHVLTAAANLGKLVQAAEWIVAMSRPAAASGALSCVRVCTYRAEPYYFCQEGPSEGVCQRAQDGKAFADADCTLQCLTSELPDTTQPDSVVNLEDQPISPPEARNDSNTDSALLQDPLPAAAPAEEGNSPLPSGDGGARSSLACKPGRIWW
jgi:hypothetical protein